VSQVTIVLSTYNRPWALRLAIEGVLGQTRDDWRLLVVGDACSRSIGRCVRGFRDPRIHYVNLSGRFGEQSGPNSVGLLLAETPYVCFLNHDDLWLPDFLERGLAALEREKADFHTGGTAFIAQDPQTLFDYHVIERSAQSRRIEEAFLAAPFLFEPISAWILRKGAAQRVGPFRHSSEIHRLPLIDWLNRAAREGLKHCDDQTFTVVKDNCRPRLLPRRQYYKELPLGLWRASRRLRKLGCEGFRLHLEESFKGCLSLGWVPRDPYEAPPLPKRVHAKLGERVTAQMRDHFLETGEDLFEVSRDEAGTVKGGSIRNILQQRTGEDMPAPPDLEAMLAEARASLPWGRA
jgi:glycosyltransferase involved in cell wall biosynthesis